MNPLPGPVVARAVLPVGQDDPSAPLGCAALRLLRGEPLVRHAVAALLGSGVVETVVVAAPAQLVAAITALLEDPPLLARGAARGSGDRGGAPVAVVAVHGRGPAERVLAVLRDEALAPRDGLLVVHDPLLPMAPARLVRSVLAALAEPDPRTPSDGDSPDAVVPVLPVSDTLKRVDVHDDVTATLDRAGYRTVSGPQAYRTAVLWAALEAAAPDGLNDLAAELLPGLVAAGGGRVLMVDAPGDVVRVAAEEDLMLAEAMAADP